MLSSSSSSTLSSSLKEPAQSQKADEDDNSSDIFYQKGVLFSAKLDDTDNYYETNSSSSIVDTLPDNHMSRELSFEYRNESNEIPFVVETSNNNFFSIPKFYSTSHLAFHPLKGEPTRLFFCSVTIAD
jgi:hypothetical protein